MIIYDKSDTSSKYLRSSFIKHYYKRLSGIFRSIPVGEWRQMVPYKFFSDNITWILMINFLLINHSRFYPIFVYLSGVNTYLVYLLICFKWFPLLFILIWVYLLGFHTEMCIMAAHTFVYHRIICLHVYTQACVSMQTIFFTEMSFTVFTLVLYHKKHVSYKHSRKLFT